MKGTKNERELIKMKGLVKNIIDSMDSRDSKNAKKAKRHLIRACDAPKGPQSSEHFIDSLFFCFFF